MIYSATITEKGQLTVPLALRKKLQTKKVAFVTQGTRIFVEPIISQADKLFGSLKPRGQKPVNLKKARKLAHVDLAKRVYKKGLK